MIVKQLCAAAYRSPVTTQLQNDDIVLFCRVTPVIIEPTQLKLNS